MPTAPSNKQWNGVQLAPKLRRVRAADVRVGAHVEPDALDVCLACWRSWMCGDSDKDLGVKTMRANSAAGMSSEEMQQANDSRIGAATDAMIDGLTRIHSWAIYRSCSMATPWGFPNADLAMVMVDAREALTQKLKNNSCTSVLF